MLETRIQILLAQHKVLSVSDDIEALLGFKPADFLTGKVILTSRIHDHDQDIGEQLFAALPAPGGGKFNLRFRQSNGRIRCIRALYSRALEPVEGNLVLTLRLQDAKSLYQAQAAITLNFKAMMENTDDFIYFKDRNHVFTGASQTFLSITEPSEHWSDLIGLTDYDVFPEAYADEYYRLEKQVFAGHAIAQEVQEILDTQGNVGWIDNRKYPIRDENGEICGLFGIARDISENVRTQLKIQQLLIDQKAILENQLVGMATVKGRDIVWANKAMVNLFGYSKQEMEGMPTRHFYANEADYVDIGNSYAELPHKSVIRRELEFVHKYGHRIWVNLSGTILNQTLGLSIWSFVDVTELKHVVLALQDSELKFRTLFEANSDAVMLIGDNGLFNCNQTTLALFGCPTIEEFCRNSLEQLSPPQQPCGKASEVLAREMIAIAKSKGSHSFEWLHKRKDNGRLFAADVRLTTMTFDNQQFIVSLVRDISQRKQAETEMRIAAVAFNSMEGMTVTDPDGIILKVNPSFCRITGYSAEEVIGKNPRVLQSGRHDRDYYQHMWRSLEISGAWEGEIWNRRKNGQIYPEYLSIAAVTDANDKLTHYVATFHDITLSKASAEEIERLAFYDPLTGLPNRRLLLNRLEPALAGSARSKRVGALLFIDLDNFKILNDSYGHDVGDQLLQQVAERLQACIREGDTVARLGGDEFVVMLTDLAKHNLEAAGLAELISQKILDRLNIPYQLGKLVHHCTPSIGATLFNGLAHNPEELLKHADIAMYEAKAAGRNALRFFDQQMQTSINARAQLENELRHALANQQFEIYLQPQVCAPNQIIGAEALIRWQHPQRGLIMPNDFIPLAEETGLIIALGQWVLEQACVQIKQWEQAEWTRDLKLAVNVSARQFRQADFVQQVCQVIQNSGIQANSLKLELTESMVLGDLNDAIEKMQALRSIGVGFSMDDFGTGYSSLGSLKRLPIDQLKIDRSFISDIATDTDDTVIVQTIIAMAHKMRIEVIAEGVETEQQKAFLVAQGCPCYQGYLFGKPMPLPAFERFLKTNPNAA